MCSRKRAKRERAFVSKEVREIILPEFVKL